MNVMTTNQVAQFLGISVRRVRQLIECGKLKATKYGRDWMIPLEEMNNVKVYGKVGRPKKRLG